jgi:GTP-binding protein Era
VNAAIGDKISIVSAIPQTTRRLIRGIYTDKNCQIIFQDVPGLHSSSHNWNQSINWVTKSALEDTDIILRIIDGARPKGLEEEMIDTLVLEAKVPVVTIVSKVDTMNEFEKHLYPKGTIFVSSITKEGIKEVIAQLATLLPK